MNYGACANELIDALVNVIGCDETMFAEFFIGDFVIPLVFIFADLSEVQVERYFLLNFLGNVLLAEVHIFRADIKDFVLHLVEILHRKMEGPSHVANMDESTLEFLLVQNQTFFPKSTINKIVDEQIKAHAVRNPERRGKAERKGISRLHDFLFRSCLGSSIQRDRT